MSSDRPESPDRSEPFLSRWSRRKQEVGREESSSTRTEQPTSPTPPRSQHEPIASASDPPIDIASLPPIEDLTASSSIEAFLRKGVPEELKRLALRKAWSLDPAIRDFVEVAENQYDWNTPGGAPSFGELNPGANMQALLDQAVGRVTETTKKDPSPTATVAATDAVPEPPEALSAQGGIQSETVAEDATEPQATPAGQLSDSRGRHQSREAVADEPAPSGSTARRRRHGGALPAA